MSVTPIYNFFPKKLKPTTASDFYSQNLPTKNNSKNEEKENETEIEALKAQNIEFKNLIAKLQDKNEIGKLQTENDDLKRENLKLKSDLACLRKLYNSACRTYVNKDFKIKMLERTVIPPSGLLFKSHKNLLGETVLRKLRKLSGCRRSDSTFVLRCMEKFYEGNRKSLSSKSACGRVGYGNNTVSPEKKNY